MQIKDLRQRLQLTQEQFAQLLGVSVQTVQRWEQGVRKPSRLALQAINNLKLKEVKR